jgi:hypothetical protein
MLATVIENQHEAGNVKKTAQVSWDKTPVWQQLL